MGKINCYRLFPSPRGRAARDLQLAESGHAAAVPGELSASARKSVGRHTGRLKHDAVTQDLFLPFTDAVEVVRSQVAVASGHTQYISSLGNYDYTKLSLFRALGVAEKGVNEYFKGR